MRYRSLVRSFEWIAVAYFVYLVAACWLPPLAASRRALVTAASAACAAGVWAIAHAAPALVRDWSPLAYILAGYFLSGYLFAVPSLPTEQWLMAWDHRLLGDPARRFVGWPRVLVAGLEVIYMGCFLLIPAGLVALVLTDHAALTDRYWTMVMGAEFAAFAPLALIQTRPPWALERKPELADPAIHRLASQMVQHLTIGVNTFPSGHAAGSLAVALAVIGALPWTGVALLGLALAICVACVIGRYHYVVDVVAGAAVAVVLWLAN
ncbi:MAG: superfamily protein [Acidobacteria bacterium]|nr:superfamily protein [Acidobacteriota bacterium]